MEQFGGNLAKHRNYYLSIVAVEDTVVLSIPILCLKLVLDKNPEALVNVVKIIGLRLQKVTLSTLKTYFGLSSNALLENQLLSKSPFRKQYGADLDDYKICYVETSKKNSEKICSKCLHKLKLVRCSGLNLCRICFMRSSVSIFQKILNLDDQVVLKQMVHQVNMKAGEMLGRLGQPFENLYFLVDGVICMSEEHPSNDSETLVDYFNGGAMLGSLSILTGEPSVFNYKLTTDCTLLAVSRINLFKSVEKNPDIIVKLGMQILNDLKLFVRQVDFGLDWIQLEATEVLYKQENVSDSAFVVLTGRLQSTALQSAKSMLTGEYGRGEIVGLPETLTQVSRGSTVVAVRDTELARLSAGLISFIKLCYPESITTLVQLLGHKILKSLPGKKNIFSMISRFPHHTQDKHLGKISTISVLQISNQIQLSLFTQLFGKALRENGQDIFMIYIKLNFISFIHFASLSLKIG